MELETFQQLWSIASAYLDITCVYFLGLSVLKCNENAVHLFKNTHSKAKIPFSSEK